MQDLIEKHLAALERAPGDDKPFHELENLLEGASRWDDLLRLYERRALAFPDSPNAPRILVRAGDLVRTRLNNMVRAEELYRRALTVGQNEVTALQGLQTVYESKGDLAALAEVLERRAVALPVKDAAPLWCELGKVYEKLHRRDRAVLAFQRSAKCDPSQTEPLLGAFANLVSLGRFKMAVEILDALRSRQAPAPGGTAGAPAALASATLAAHYASVAEKLLDSPIDHALALRAAEAALALEPGHAGAARARDEIARFKEGWRERVRALRLEANEERDRKRMASLYLSAGLAHAAFDTEDGGDKRAKEFLSKVLLLWPGMPQALDALERLAEKGDDWKGLETFYEKLAADTKERGAAVETLLRLAAVRIIRLGDREGALAAFLRATQLDPSRAEAVGLAVELLLDASRAQEAAALLEKHLATLSERRAQVMLRLKLAELLELRLSDPAGARSHLEAALSLDPTCLDAARRLAPLCEAAGDVRRLAEVLELTVPAIAAPAEKAGLLERIAGLYGERLARPADAVRALARALVLDPSRAGVRPSLERYAADGNAWETVVTAYRAAADLAGGEEGKALLKRVAQILDTPLGRLDEAIEAWRRVQALDAGDADAPGAIESLLARTGAHQELAAGWEKQLAAATDPKEKREILEKMAGALEQQSGDPASAAALYRKMLELDAEDITVLKRLGAACAALERWDEVAEVTGQMARAAKDPREAREWQARRAQVVADRLGHKEEAAEIYLELLKQDARMPGVLPALEKIAAGGVLARRIAEAVLPLYRAANDYGRAAQAMQTLISGTEDLNKKVGLMGDLAVLCEERLADRRAAFGWMEKAFRLVPSDPVPRAELERLAAEIAAQAELAALYMEVAEGVEDPALSAKLLMRSATLAESASEYDLAVQSLDRAISLPAARLEGLRALHRLAAKAERWADCERALRMRLELEPKERATLLPELASVCERFGRARDAAEALEQALSTGASETELLPRLSRLYEAAGDAQGLKSALSRELMAAEKAGDKERTARLRLKISKLLESSAGGRAAALESYAQVLAARPSDPEALAALERMMQVEATREPAARALLPAYEAGKESRKLVYALEILAECTSNPAEKASVLKRAAQIHAVDLRQGELAFSTLARALRLTPGDAQLRVATRKAAEECGQLETFVEVLDEIAEGLTGAQAVPLLRELAEVSERKLADRAGAIAHYARMLTLDEESIDALRGLHRLYRLAERWEDLAKTCQRLGKAIYDDQERVLLYREAGTLFESNLGKPEEAAACFRALAEADPVDRDAALALERLYEALGRPADLAFALELRRAQEGNSPAGREAAFKLAELKRGPLADPAGALQIFAQILADDPAHPGSRTALEAWAKAGGAGSIPAMKLIDPALERAGEHARRVALREARLGGASAEEKATLAGEIRHIYERDMARPELAFMATCRAYAEGIAREETVVHLERLARETGSVEELASVFESVAETSLPGDESGSFALRRAAQLRAQLGEAETAVALWKDLLREKPGDREALDALATLHEHTQNARELAEVYRQKAALTQDPAQRAGLLLQAGAAKMQLGEEAAAVELGKAVLAISPKNRPALEMLDRAYDRLEMPAEHADVLRQLAELVAEPPARRALLLRRAELLEKQGEPALAVEAFAKVLAESPGESAAVAGLERLFGANEQARLLAAKVLEAHYRSVDDGRHLCEVLEVKASQAPKEERQAVLLECARLREALGQKPLAFAAVLRCFHDSPESETIRTELERLAAETGSFEELAAAYEDELDRKPAPELELEFWRRLGAIWGDRLGRPEKSAEALEEVIKRTPADAATLETLSRIYRRTSGLRELAGVLWKQVGLATEPPRKRDLLVELATLSEEKLNDREAAISAWRELLTIREGDGQALGALSRLLAEAGRFDELAALLELRSGLAEKQGKVEVSFELQVELGRVKLMRLADPRGALAIFTDILARRPGHPRAVAALEEMANGEWGLRAEAAMALEPVFTATGDHLKLVQMLENRSQGATPAEKAMLLRRVAEVQAGPLDSLEMAFLYAWRALEAAPDEIASLDLCVKYGEQAGMAEELAGNIAGVVERARTDEARVALQRALGRLLTRQKEESEQAVAAYKRLLELAPGDAEALDALAALYRERGLWGDLLEVLRRQLAVAQTAELRAGLLRRIGELQEEQLNDTSAAIATFRRLLEVHPEDPEALERLDRLCLQSERWAELADTLGKEIALAAKHGAKDELVTLQYRLAQVRDLRLLDRAGALALYGEVLAARPMHPDAVDRLEQLVAKEPSYDEAADLLAASYRATSEHAKLAKLLEDRASASPDASARKRFLSELAKVRAQHMERSDLAFLALCRAFREEPGDAETRAALERVAEQSESFEELAAVYEEELPNVGGPDAAAICLKLAGLNETRLSEPELAIGYYERARVFDPAASVPALQALDRLYREKEEWGKLVEALTALVDLTAEPADKSALLFRLGQLCQEKLDPPSPERAVRAFEAIRVLEPGHMAAARALEKLYEAAGQQQALFDILEVQRAHVAGPEKERLTLRMGEVAAKGLKDPEKAIGLFGEALAANPRSEPAFAALESLYEQTKKYDTLAEMLKRRLSLTVDPREITKLSDKLGRAQALLGHADDAVASFKAALERDPRNRRALESLRDIYAQTGKTEELAAVLRRLIPLQDDAGAVKKVRLQLAETLAALSRREEALESARRVLDIEPHEDEDLNRAEALYRSLESWTDLVRAMEARAELLRAAGETAGAISVLFAVGEVHADQLQRRETAAPIYERIVELSPGERLAFDALREIYTAQGDWRRYAAACDKFLPGVSAPAERVEILKDLGSVQETRLGHKDLAFLSFCRAFGEAPGDEGAREAMHRLAEETGSWEELATIYEEIVEGVEKGPLAERLYLALARVHDEKLDQPDEAETALRKVLEFDSANKAALEALAGMFARRGKDSEYILSLEQKLEAAASIEERKAILREIAGVQDGRLHKPEEAAAAYLRALELEPDRETLRTLVELYRREKKFGEMAEVLLRARDFETDPAMRSRLQLEIAEAYEREIRDDEAAVAAYQLAVEFDPQNREALFALERLYTKLDRFRELLGIYDAQIRLADDARERVKILFKSAGIWEDKLQNLENADACLEAIFGVDPGNLQAIKSLERLRRLDAEQSHVASRWEDLIRAYERHLEVAPEVAEQVSLLVLMGEVQYKELKRTDRAAQIFHRALELDPRSGEAMHALGLLYERSGNWPFALDMLAREAEILGASPDAVEIFHRVAKINEEMLLDTGSAKAAYQRALAIDAGYLPSLRALKGLYEAEKDWDRYLEVLVQEAEHTIDPEDRAHAFLEVARFYQDAREDRDSAARYYEEALKLTPDALDGARPLADIYVARESWEQAEQMLDVVARHLAEGAARDPQVGADLCRQLYRLGYVCEKLKKQERALGAYERAYQLDATYLPSAEGYANLLSAGGRFADALNVYQAILIHHREALTDLEVVEYYWQVGELYRKLGQPERAQKEFDKALAIDAGHEPCLRAQVELAEAASDWEGALEYRLRLVPLLEDAGKFEVLGAIGGIARERLRDPYRAIDAYAEAARLNEGATEVLEALVALYRETRQAGRAVQALEKLIATPEVAGDPARAKKLWYALGEVLRDEVKDVPKAVEAFNRALDLDFRFVQAFAAVETLLAQSKLWPALEENYHRMIQRLPKTEETHAARMSLFKTLGDFYEKVKKDKRASKQVYLVVVRGLPDDVAALEKYAALATEEEGSEAEAIDAWRRLLPVSATPQTVVKQLARLYAKTKDYDGAYVAAQVSAHLLGEQGPEEAEILKKLAPYAKRKEQAQRPLTDSMWAAQLFHPKVRGPMAEILALLYHQLGPSWSKKPAALGVDPKAHRIDLENSLELAITSYRYVLQILGMESLELYSPFLVATRERLKQKAAAGPVPEKDLYLEVLGTHPVSLKAGGKLFGEQGQKEMFFFAAKAVAWTRPELVLARILTAEKLEAVFQAAVLTGVPSFKVTADPRAIDQEMRTLERIEPQYRMALARLGREFAKVASPSGTDVRDFIEGAELTANRVAALLSSDLEVAKNAMAKDSTSKVTLRARSRDLMMYAMSKEFAELRGELGMRIEVRIPGK